MLNPYYYLVYLFYSLFRKAKIYEEGEDLFMAESGVLLLIIFESLFVLFVLKFRFNIHKNIFPDGNLFIFATIIIVFYYTCSYFILRKNGKYKLIIEKMENADKPKKYFTIFFLISFFSIPLALLIYSYL